MAGKDRRPFSRPLSSEDRALSDEAIQWFARLRSGSPSRQDQQDFEVWRRRSDSHERAWQEICALYNEPELMKAAAHVQGPSLLHMAGPRLRWRGIVSVIGALAILVLGLIKLELIGTSRADYRTWTVLPPAWMKLIQGLQVEKLAVGQKK